MNLFKKFKEMLIRIVSFYGILNAQVALPTFHGVQKSHISVASCDQSITVSTSDEGWYKSNGEHNSTNTNTYTRFNSYRSWFTFDLSSFPGNACSVTLRLGLELFNGSTKTHTIYDVSTSHSDLTSNSSSDITIYQDLGSGNSYSSKSISSSDRGTVIEYTFNAQGISDLNNAAGGWFSIGTTVSEGAARFGTNINSQTSELIIIYSN